VVALLAALLLVPTGVAAALVARRVLADTEWLEAREQADATAAAVRLGGLAGTIVPRVASIDLIQVLVPGHRVVASSAAARGLPPMTMVWPSPRDPQQDVQTCVQARVGCVRISALRVSTAPDSPVVYAGRRTPGPISTGAFDLLFAGQVAALIFIAIWAAWKVTGRTLRPVNAIRAELAAINVNDLSTRVPEPSGEDEIARLARTVNGTLGRLEHAKGRTEQALQKQRRFASDASHELRTPIAGLRAQLEEAQLHPDDTDLREMLSRALSDVDRLESITSDLLLLTRLGADMPATLETLDLAELVRAEVAQRKDRHPVRLHLASGTTVDGVPTHIGRLLTNLLDNAQRHAKHQVQVEVRRGAGMAELIVSDDGGGIAEADRERIFQPFTRMDAARSREHGGTGLGLAIAQDIAHAHKGTLHVEDQPGGGARFILRLPLIAPRTDQPTQT
jgi:signal transduction histidine kinase